MLNGNIGIAIRSIGAVSRFGVGYQALLRGLFDPCVPGENPNLSEYEMAMLALREATQAMTPGGFEGAALILATTFRQTDNGAASILLKKLAQGYGIHGARLCFTNACSAGISALSAATALLLSGKTETVLVLGVVANLEENVKGFASLGVTGDHPSRPFSADRKFMELGTGAVCFCLECARNTCDLTLQMLQTGFQSDNMVRPNAPFISAFYRTAVQSMQAEPEVFLAHATGTIPNDETETTALKEALPAGARVSSLKSSVGHTLEASALFNLAAACGIYENMQQLPVTRNCGASILPSPLTICAQEEVLGEAPESVMGASIGMDGNAGVFAVGRIGARSPVPELLLVSTSCFTPWTPSGTPFPLLPGEPADGASDILHSVLLELPRYGCGAPLYGADSELALAITSPECLPAKFTGRRMTPADFFGRLASFPLAMAARQVGHAGALSAFSSDEDDLHDILYYGWAMIATGMLKVCSILQLALYDGRVAGRGIVFAESSCAPCMPPCPLAQLHKIV